MKRCMGREETDVCSEPLHASPDSSPCSSAGDNKSRRDSPFSRRRDLWTTDPTGPDPRHATNPEPQPTLGHFFFLSSSTTVASARVRFPFRDLDCGPFFASLLKCHLVSNKFFPHHHNPFLPATPTLYQHLSQLILS